MNHIYRIVFNRALGVYQVASENASAHRSGSKRLALSITGALVMAVLAGAPAGAFAQSVSNAGGTGGQGGAGMMPGIFGGQAGQQGTSGSALPSGGASGGGGGGSGAAGGNGGLSTSSGAILPAAGGIAGVSSNTSGNITTGTAGGNGAAGSGPDDGGGGGGGGASAGNYAADMTLNDIYTGGAGGSGGAGGPGGSGSDANGGGGGAGGYGVQATGGNLTITETAVVSGGLGGTGGSSNMSRAGNGGDGGIGVEFSSGGTLANSGQIRGGNGGNASSSLPYGVTSGGVGGAGVVLGDGATLVNSQNTNGNSSIYGGDIAVFSGNNSLRGGTGVIAGNNTVIINDSVISGGQGSTADLQGYAVEINGSNNRLVMQTNGSLDGNVIARGTNNTLEYNIVQSNNGLDVSTIVSAEPLVFDSAAKLYGFSNYEKTGDGQLSLVNTTDVVTNWTVKDGKLGITNEINLGAAGSKLTLDGGTLFVDRDMTISSAHDIAMGAAGGTVETLPGKTVQFVGVISGNGGLAMTGNGTIVLQADNTYTGVTHAKAGTIRIGNGATAGSVAGNIAIEQGAIVEFDRSDDVTYAGVISGAGQLKKSNTNTLTLLGNNTGTGLDSWRINGGTLQVGNGGTIGSIAADVKFESGALVFNRAGNSTYAGAISDVDSSVYAGTVEKRGTGTLTLTGANNYRGGTTVTGGTLEVGNGGTIGSIVGAVTIAAGATLAFNRQDDIAYSSVISGDGSLEKRGSGQLTINQPNTYTGGTRVSNGNLVVGNGGTNGSIVGDVQVDQAGTLVFNRSDTVTFAGAISGDGSLTKRNSNTLILTGDNTFTGGIKLAQGTLQIANGVTSGSIVSDVMLTSGTTLAFAHRNSSSSPYDPYDYVGNIAGDGQVVVRANSEVSFTGDATHTGGTVVEPNATLALGNGGTTGSLGGDVTLQNSAAFGFLRSNDYTYAGKITGDSTSRIVQAGTGTTSLTGDNSGFSGLVYVTAGTLEINSAMNGIAAVIGGTLAGTGQLAMAQIGDGGTLSPGSKANPTGTLTTNGPVQFTTGSTLSINALPDGSSSKLVVNGATLVQDGAKFQMVGLGNGLYAESTTYNVLQATGGVNGTFTTVASSLAFLEPSLSYTANAVDLTVKLKDVPVDPGQGGSGGGDTGTGNTGGNGNGGNGGNGNTGGSSGGTRPIQFADLALNRNQRSVAGALQSLPKNSALYARVLNLPEGTPSAVFESLSGETHASTSNMLNGVTSNVVSLPMSHLRQNMDAGMMPGRPTAQIGRGDASSLPQSAAQPIWAQVFGNWRTLGGRDETGEVRQSDGGLFVGGDQAVGGGWRAGGALGYTGSHSSIKGQGSRADVDSYSGVIYGGKGFAAGPGKINLTLGMSYTWHDIDTKRGVNAAGVAQELKSSYSANTTQFFTELGYALPVTDRVTLEPFVGADYSDQRTRGFGESGGDAALTGKSTHNQVGSTTLGLRGQTTFESGSSQGRLYATAGWRHSYGDLDPTTTMAFDGSQAFSVAGAPIARDAAVLTLGADLAITRSTTVGVNYGGQFGGGNRQNSGAVNVRWRF
ncbi:autotransporter domain-containing protein [Bordetella sp. LUAb4]|uniref:autotransporter domain-containing protein n=1 Tax=Bordetella sp. LUAb4 TaxID=2843195 RepID=UPI001E416409|nr:autotransporter domain-containing protein [Bordetella sp. LUAb4]